MNSLDNDDIKHLNIHQNYSRLPKVDAQEVLTWEFPALKKRDGLSSVLLRGSALESQMSHWLGHDRQREFRARMYYEVYEMSLTSLSWKICGVRWPSIEST